MSMRVLHTLSQRPSLTGSGVPLVLAAALAPFAWGAVFRRIEAIWKETTA